MSGQNFGKVGVILDDVSQHLGGLFRQDIGAMGLDCILEHLA